MSTLKQLIANAEACKPYWIDTAVYFSEGIARKAGGTRWAAGTYAMPQLPGMTCTPTKGGFFRYCIECETVPAESPELWKASRLAILEKHDIPILKKGKAEVVKPAPVSKSAPRKTAKATPATADKKGQFVFQF